MSIPVALAVASDLVVLSGCVSCAGVIPVLVPVLRKKKQKLNISLLLVVKTSRSMVSIILHHLAKEVFLAVQP